MKWVWFTSADASVSIGSPEGFESGDEGGYACVHMYRRNEFAVFAYAYDRDLIKALRSCHTDEDAEAAITIAQAVIDEAARRKRGNAPA